MPLFEHFLAALPPDPGVTRLGDAALARITTEHTPSDLLAFYRDIGIGSFGGGVLYVEEPATLEPVLAVWLNQSPKRIPFARTAFGDLFYYRDLREEAKAKGMSGENPGELEDVSWVDVHLATIDVVSFSILDFFDDVLGMPDNIDTVLRGGLVRAARELHGPLKRSEQLGFVPALGLGGSEDLTSVQKVDMLVHTMLLRQLQ